MADVLFSGGPCSGKHEHVDDAAVADGRLVCGGMNYRVYDVGGAGAPGEYLALPPNVKPPAQITARAPSAARAWRRLVHAVVTQVPADVRASQRSRRHILRIARR